MIAVKELLDYGEDVLGSYPDSACFCRDYNMYMFLFVSSIVTGVSGVGEEPATLITKCKKNAKPEGRHFLFKLC